MTGIDEASLLGDFRDGLPVEPPVCEQLPGLVQAHSEQFGAECRAGCGENRIEGRLGHAVESGQVVHAETGIAEMLADAALQASAVRDGDFAPVLQAADKILCFALLYRFDVLSEVSEGLLDIAMALTDGANIPRDTIQVYARALKLLSSGLNLDRAAAGPMLLELKKVRTLALSRA